MMICIIQSINIRAAGAAYFENFIFKNPYYSGVKPDKIL
jgi:hypothetical protein